MTLKQKRFADEYIKSGNATQSYFKAYDTCKTQNTAEVNGCRLLSNAKVYNYIAKERAKMEEKEIVTREKVMSELAALAFSNGTSYAKVTPDGVEVKLTDQLTDVEKKAVAGVKQGQFGVEVKTYDKVKALELLSKLMGYDKPADEDKDDSVNIVIKPREGR